MYFKRLKYEISDCKLNPSLEIYIYSHRLFNWVKLAEIKGFSNGSLIMYFFGDIDPSKYVHFTFFDNADECRYDIRQFVHDDINFVNEPDDFDELINSWKLMAEMNKKEE